MRPASLPPAAPHPAGSAGEVFTAFLRLGLTSFGGPLAHLGYLRQQFVTRRGWLDESGFAQLLAVCQFLPGPASSQLSLAIGLFRAGWAGALAAFVGFTLPSALLLFAFAGLAQRLDPTLGAALVHGLKLVAVAVVAHGVLGMWRQLVPDAARGLIAIVALALAVLVGSVAGQLLAIGCGAVLGLGLCRRAGALDVAVFPLHYGRRTAAAVLALFLVGLAVALLCVPATGSPGPLALAAAFYQAGALVFGGGHVVLPLLQHSVVDSGWVTAETFLAGYGAAQAVPGPMFAVAAFLGAEVPLGLPPAVGALIALLALFAPGFLLLLAVLPVWSALARHRAAARAVAGVNAAVVGLLLAALHDPVWPQGIRTPVDLVIAATGFVLLARWHVPAGWVVLWCVTASLLASLAG